MCLEAGIYCYSPTPRGCFRGQIDLSARLIPLLRDGGTSARLVCLYGDQCADQVKYNPLMKFYEAWEADKNMIIEPESELTSDDEEEESF